MLLFTIIRLVILTATIFVAVKYWQHYKQSHQRLFLYFIIYSLFSELIGAYLGPYLHIKQHFVYNIYTIVSFLFYMYWFFLVTKQTKFIRFCSVLFICSVILSIYYNGFNNKVLTEPITIGTIIIILLSAIFLRNLLNTKQVINYKNSQQFWIVTGLLIFYIGFLPLQLLLFYLNTYSNSYNIILILLNILLYGCFIMSFLCLKKK